MKLYLGKIKSTLTNQIRIVLYSKTILEKRHQNLHLKLLNAVTHILDELDPGKNFGPTHTLVLVRLALVDQRHEE